MLGKLVNRKIMIASATGATLITMYLVLLSPIFSMTNTARSGAEAAEPEEGTSVVYFLEIDGEVISALREVDGISAETQVIESKQGGDNKAIAKLAGSTEYANLVLRRALTDDLAFSDWFAKTASGNPEKKTASIAIRDFAGETIARYNFANAWPCKYNLSPFDAASEGPIIETIELCHEQMIRVAP